MLDPYSLQQRRDSYVQAIASACAFTSEVAFTYRQSPDMTLQDCEVATAKLVVRIADAVIAEVDRTDESLRSSNV